MLVGSALWETYAMPSFIGAGELLHADWARGDAERERELLHDIGLTTSKSDCDEELGN